MQDLTQTQRTVLNKAANRPRQIALPLPGDLPAGAQAKVIAALIRRGLLAEADPAPGDPLWRDTGRTLALTATGMEAIGFDSVVVRAVTAKPGKPSDDHAPAPAPREGTKQATLIAMLRRPEGASIAEITEVTSWAPHTVRGAIAGALKRRLGLTVVSDKDGQRGRVYRITD